MNSDAMKAAQQSKKFSENPSFAMKGGSGWDISYSLKGPRRVFAETLKQGNSRVCSMIDILIIGFGLALALVFASVFWFGNGIDTGQPEGTPNGTDAGIVYDGGRQIANKDDVFYAVVQTSDGYYAELPLDANTRIKVSSELGSNVIEVSDGAVRVVEADCSNQICVNEGWISQEGQLVVCLPHKLTVQIVRDPADAIPLTTL